MRDGSQTAREGAASEAGPVDRKVKAWVEQFQLVAHMRQIGGELTALEERTAKLLRAEREDRQMAIAETHRLCAAVEQRITAWVEQSVAAAVEKWVTDREKEANAARVREKQAARDQEDLAALEALAKARETSAKDALQREARERDAKEQEAREREAREAATRREWESKQQEATMANQKAMESLAAERRALTAEREALAAERARTEQAAREAREQESRARQAGGGAALWEALEQTGGADGEIVLELTGEGVQDVSPEERRIIHSFDSGPLLVGRRHQLELHKRAVASDCLGYVSRDHFKISAEGGQFFLQGLAVNPLWRVSEDLSVVELETNESVPLKSGDCIALSTGGGCEEAMRRLRWHFRVHGAVS